MSVDHSVAPHPQNRDEDREVIVNPFIATACKIFGPKDANSICSGPIGITRLLSLLYIFMKIFSYASAKKKTKKLKCFKLSRFYWPFSNDIMAMKRGTL